MLTEVTRAYFAEIGRRGGRKSRRALSPEQARRMVALRVARSALRKFRTLCFWSAPQSLEVTPENLPWVIEQLRRNGNRAAWQVAACVESLTQCP
jgi:hypothetical protein